jgi:hypothetical protein
MAADFILVPGPLVGASSWAPSAEQLRFAGHRVQVPDILARHATPPTWSAWTWHLLEQLAAASEPFVVGHSSASVLVAELATRMPVQGIIIVDGEVPPSQGAASAVRPALHEHIRSVAGADGMLPIWSRWFTNDARRLSLIGLDLLAADPAALARFEAELPKLHAGWFDDTIELANWDHVPAGFIQTSPIYDHAIAEAQRRGWPVIRLQGTHLHPTLRPVETADAIMAMSRQLRGDR